MLTHWSTLKRLDTIVWTSWDIYGYILAPSATCFTNFKNKQFRLYYTKLPVRFRFWILDPSFQCARSVRVAQCHQINLSCSSAITQHNFGGSFFLLRTCYHYPDPINASCMCNCAHWSAYIEKRKSANRFKFMACILSGYSALLSD